MSFSNLKSYLKGLVNAGPNLLHWAQHRTNTERSGASSELETLLDDTDITALTEVTSISTTDIVHTKVNPATDDLSRKVTWANVLSTFQITISGGTVTVDASLEATGDVILPLTKALYFGDPNTDGSWRIMEGEGTGTGTGNDLVFERRESGSWVHKGSFTDEA